jgi:hypothetical protein
MMDHMKLDLKVRLFIHYKSMSWAMPTWIHGKMHAEGFLQRSVPTCPWYSALHRWVCYLPECTFSKHCLLG